MAGTDDIIAQTLGLPWNIQVAIGSGYSAYLLAYRGIRNSHKTIDIAFSTLVFASAATATLWLRRADHAPVQNGLIAFGITIALALFWRRLGRGLLHVVLRRFDITWSNDDPSAIDTLTSDSRSRVTQIAVLMDDGTWLRCDDTKPFEHLPFGPYTLGQTGDIALYLTHERKPNEEAKELRTVTDSFGSRISYVPAAKIKQINIRYENEISRFRKAAAWLRSWFGWVKLLAEQKPGTSADENLQGSHREVQNGQL